ncbi:MAG: alanine racemase [Ruminococcaceae bacterium]|nr:alanine racemase [Oscillospiraceae bacterium]
MKTDKFASYAIIDLDNLAHNLKTVRKNLTNADILAIVKADAYNHGSEQIAKKLFSLGVHNFAVANIDEALALRNCGVGGMILVLGPMLPSRYCDAVKENISVTADSAETLASLDEYTKRSGNILKFHMALNTGMNRIGFNASEGFSSELEKAANVIKSNKNMIPEGIFSHLCDADNDDEAFTRKQYERFDNACRILSEAGIIFGMKHICNSAGTWKYPEFHLDLVRFGIGLYGCEDYSGSLLPVMSFKTHIAQISKVRKNETIGYGLTYVAEKDMTIATVTAGYADGFNRKLSNNGDVLIRGRRAPIVGRVCMDMTMVDISDIPEASLFDEVTIIGKDGDEIITAEEVAKRCDTISYEILCGIGKRVNRLYVENGKLI